MLKGKRAVYESQAQKEENTQDEQAQCGSNSNLQETKQAIPLFLRPSPS